MPGIADGQLLYRITQDEGLSPLEKTQMAWHVIRLMIKVGNLKEALERLEDDISARIVPNSGESIELQGTFRLFYRIIAS